MGIWSKKKKKKKKHSRTSASLLSELSSFRIHMIDIDFLSLACDIDVFLASHSETGRIRNFYFLNWSESLEKLTNLRFFSSTSVFLAQFKPLCSCPRRAQKSCKDQWTSLQYGRKKEACPRILRKARVRFYCRIRGDKRTSAQRTKAS